MKNEKVKRILTDASASLDQVKGALFDASRECVNGENGSEWNIAKTIIDLAESADSLKRQLKSLAYGAEPDSGSVEVRPTLTLPSRREIPSGQGVSARRIIRSTACAGIGW